MGSRRASSAGLITAIPTRNGQRFLSQALRSVARQSVAPDRVVILDEGGRLVYYGNPVEAVILDRPVETGTWKIRVLTSDTTTNPAENVPCIFGAGTPPQGDDVSLNLPGDGTPVVTTARNGAVVHLAEGGAVRAVEDPGDGEGLVRETGAVLAAAPRVPARAAADINSFA